MINIAQTIIKEILDRMSIIPDSIEVEKDERGLYCKIIVSDGRFLVGRDGAAIDALNTLVRRIFEARSKDQTTRLILDVNNHRKDGEEKLRQTAKMLANRAKEFNAPVELDPMTSYERLVVHEVFAESREFKTISTGEGKNRHIVIHYIGEVV